MLNDAKLMTPSSSQANSRTIELGSMVTNEVISGKRALLKAKQLQNNGCIKRLLNGYIKQDGVDYDQSSKSG